MKEVLNNGLWPVMITPFNDDGSIDWKSLKQLTEWYIKNGSAGLFANCLSSEMYFLEKKEMLELVTRIVKICKNRIQVIATGTFGNDLKEKAEFCKKMADTGVNAVVAINCLMAQENETEEQLKKSYETLLNLTGDIAFGLYECPKPYHRLLTPQMTQWLAQTNRFLYLKETSRSPELIKQKIEASKGTSLKIFNAHTPTGLKTLQLGSAGISCIAANFYPDLLAWVCKNWQKHPEKAQKLQQQLSLLDRSIRINYPKSAKWYIKHFAINISEYCRIPDIKFDSDDETILPIIEKEAVRIRKIL